MNMDNHEASFAEAWNRQCHTSIELEPLNVNEVVADAYDVEELTLTRAQLWKMEVKKAPGLACSSPA